MPVLESGNDDPGSRGGRYRRGKLQERLPHQQRTQTSPLPPLIDPETRHHDRRHRQPLQRPQPRRRHPRTSLHLERTQPVANHHPTTVPGDLDDYTRPSVDRDRVLPQPVIHGGITAADVQPVMRSGSMRSICTASTHVLSSSTGAVTVERSARRGKGLAAIRQAGRHEDVPPAVQTATYRTLTTQTSTRSSTHANPSRVIRPPAEHHALVFDGPGQRQCHPNSHRASTACQARLASAL